MLNRIALAAVVGLVGVAVAAEPQEKPRAKVEFRRAESKPTDGLTAAKIVGTDQKIYLHPKAELTEKDVAGAALNVGPTIEITLTEAGAKKMEKLSGGHIDKPLAILVDGKVISAPVVRAKLGGNVAITGSFTADEAQNLVNLINGK
jgi:preprotein translocase subunit SecD